MQLKIIFPFILMCFFVSTAFGQGCEYDSQCKGDRICDNGRCVSPGGDGTGGGNHSDGENKEGSRSTEQSRTCKYIGGPKAGQIEYFPPSVPINPARVGQQCNDGVASYGYAIPDQQ